MRIVGLSTLVFLSSVGFGQPRAFGPCIYDAVKDQCYVDLGGGTRGTYCVLDQNDPSLPNGMCRYTESLTAGQSPCTCVANSNPSGPPARPKNKANSAR